MRTLTAILVTLALAPPAGADPIELPAEVKGEVGDFLTIQAKTAGKVVLWVLLDDPKGLKLFPGDLLKDSRTAVVIGRKPGKYRLQAITAVGDVPSHAICTVTIEGEPAPPKPPSPPPSDPLAQKLQAAFTADATPAALKAGQKVLLQGLYEAAAQHAQDPTIATTGALLDDLKKTAAAMLAPSALVECRKAIAAEIAVTLGTDPATKLDGPTREKAVTLFTSIARALAAVR
jgi:hypothetical protein